MLFDFVLHLLFSFLFRFLQFSFYFDLPFFPISFKFIFHILQCVLSFDFSLNLVFHFIKVLFKLVIKFSVNLFRVSHMVNTFRKHSDYFILIDVFCDLLSNIVMRFGLLTLLDYRWVHT